MLSVLADMSVSTGGIIRLSKRLIEKIGVESGDRLVVLKDNPNNKIIIQFQRDDEVIFRLEGGKLS